MLVLSRKRGEKIVVPQWALSVTVVSLQGNAVRLGISAPPEVAVHREELWREIREESPALPQNSVDAFTAEVSAAAQRIAQHHGLADSWVDVLKNWSRQLESPLVSATGHASGSKSSRRPR